MKFEYLKEYMIKRNFSAGVVKRGPVGELVSWAKTVKSICKKPTHWNKFEYINDIDGRRILEELICMMNDSDKETFRSQVSKIDNLLKGRISPVKEYIGTPISEECTLEINPHDHPWAYAWPTFAIEEKYFDIRKYTLYSLEEKGIDSNKINILNEIELSDFDKD